MSFRSTEPARPPFRRLHLGGAETAATPLRGRAGVAGAVLLGCAGIGGALLLAPPASAQSLAWFGEVHFPVDPGGCGGGPTGGSDVWGYTAPDGTEYAIMGVLEGVAVVRIPDLTVIDVIAGPQDFDCYYHRDIKTYGHYAYVTNEMAGTNEGLLILDLQHLPDHVEYVGSYTNFSITSHNLSIDTATGYAYLQEPGGVRIVSLANPTAPVDVEYIPITGTHDVFAQNDLLYVAEGFMSRYSVWDVSDKLNPVRLALVSVPGGYAHNIWASADGSHFMTTEETTDRTVKMWDASDVAHPVVVGEWLGGNGLAHNTHLMGDLAIISHYSYGVALVDISNPAAPFELDRWDTYPAHDTPAFVGCWGAYPFTNGGWIYASDIEGDLVVLRLDDPAGLEDPSDAADQLSAFPNPTGAETALRFHLSEAAEVRLGIYAASGERVRALQAGLAPRGPQSFAWDGRDDRGRLVANGTYFARLEVGGPIPYEATRKLVRRR